MDVSNFGKVWESEYIIKRVKEIEKAVNEGNHELAIDYLSMIEEKAELAIDFLREESKSNLGLDFLMEMYKRARKTNPSTEDISQQLKNKGYEVKLLSISEYMDTRHTCNPFLEATKDKETIEEKEIKARELLDMLNICCRPILFSNHADMSFLDDDPEWKERATEILREYADKLADEDNK